jgi:hypothetical protein
MSTQEAIAVEETESEDSDKMQDASGSPYVSNIFLLDVKTCEL